MAPFLPRIFGSGSAILAGDAEKGTVRPRSPTGTAVDRLPESLPPRYSELGPSCRRHERADQALSPLHVALALLVVVIWGLAFVATKIGLESLSPPQLTALRFLIAAVPALWLPRPPLPWSRLIAIGATLFAGQFLLQFFAIANGVPPGLASLLVQTQALFTILFAAITLRERPTTRQVFGVAVAFAGLVLIVLTVGQDLTIVGFCLAMGSAIS